MWGFGLYIAPLEAEFGWSRAEVALGFSFSLLASGLLSPLLGRAVDRHGPRRTIMAGTVLTTASYALLSVTGSLWEWYVYFTLNGVFRHMITFIPMQSLIARWFSEHRGRALGILMAGFVGGGLVMVPVVRLVIDALGWSGAFIFTGVLIGAFFLPFVFFVVRDTPPSQTRVDEVRPALDPVVADLSVGMAMRTPIFWFYALALAAFFYGFVGWQVHAVPYYESVGVSPGWAAGLVSIGAAGAMVGRITFGIVADRLRALEAAAILLVLAFIIGLLVLLVTASSPVGLAVFLFCFAIGSGGGPLVEPLLLTKTFGVTHFASIFGIVYLLDTIGIVASPTVAAVVFDVTGSYDLVLVMLIGAFALSVAALGVAARLPKPVLEHSTGTGPVARVRHDMGPADLDPPF